MESEGADYARYVAYQPNIKSYLREQMRMATDDILQEEMGKQADGSWLIGWDDIKEHLDITVSKTNGIPSNAMPAGGQRMTMGERREHQRTAGRKGGGLRTAPRDN